MKILIISNKFPYPPYDGGALATLNMIRGLVKNGHQITLISLNTTKHFFGDDPEMVEIKEKIKIHLVPVNTRIRIHALVFNLLFSTYPYILQRFHTPEMKRVLATHLDHVSYDLVQLEGLAVCQYLPSIRAHHRGPVSLRAHNVEHHIWLKRAERHRNLLIRYYSALTGRRLKKAETAALNNIDLLVPISANDAKAFRNMGYDKPLEIIPAGIDSTGTQAVLFPSPSLVYIGALDWYPNQEGLMWFLQMVWPTLKKKVPRLECHVAGRNAPRWLINRLKRAGILFHGEVASARDFLSAGWIQIVPLFTGSGIRVKILEGMSLGKAIVATPQAAEGIPVTNGKEIILASSPRDFIHAIRRLTGKPSSITQLGQNARVFVRENFDNFVMGARLTGFYMKYCT
ncbi:MAG TPA: glycosyltransferase [Bacteroidetes bacterium]|nr:glycosyltransferase [Bacteroidota bacterium]